MGNQLISTDPNYDVLSEMVRAGAQVSGFERALAPMDEIFVRIVQQGEA